jgi:CBS domain containing-hemolysin-like protein
MYPIIWVLNNCSALLLKIAGLSAAHPADNFYSTKEIKLILDASQLYGELTQAETEIIEQTLDFADLKVKEVMRPYSDIVTLDISQPMPQLLRKIFERRYSRYPVYDKHQQALIGIIHVKDLFAALYRKDHQADEMSLDLRSLIRPILKVNADLPALDLLYQFRAGTSHFAVVYDYLQQPFGFITWDNLLQVVLGHVKDEFHKTEDSWILNADGTLQVRGDCTIFAFEKALQQEILPESEDVDTLAGLIVKQMGFVPKEGAHVQFPLFEAIVEKTRGSRILWVKVIPKVVDTDEQKP